MMLHREEGTRKDLVYHRLETAKEDLKSAKVLSGIGDYRGANNRAYYAIYHAISAVHALKGKAYKKHKDAVSNFNKDYVKTEIFAKKYGRQISHAEVIRHASDYNDFYIASKSETMQLINNAEELISVIEKYCEEQIKTL